MDRPTGLPPAIDDTRAEAGWPFAPGDLMAGLPDTVRRKLGRPAGWFALWPVLILLAGPLAGILTGLTFGFVSGRLDSPDPHLIFRLLHPALALAYIAVFFIFARWAVRRGLGNAVIDPRPRQIATESALAFLFLVLTIVFGGLLLNALTELLGAQPSPQNLVPAEAGPSLFWIALPAVVVIGPAVEEMIFRGWMLPALRARGLGWIAAIALSSLLFGALHSPAGLLPFVYTTLVGISAGILRVQTGRLFAPILFHALNNLVVIGLPQIVAQTAG
ncbi:MAG: hypothetical protein CMF74_05520 [Maricaulis sp.]|jgi:membrane protease YdiL (CAAX protease family)|nr:hypothetical protein [Maricaulis sp.]